MPKPSNVTASEVAANKRIFRDTTDLLMNCAGVTAIGGPDSTLERLPDADVGEGATALSHGGQLVAGAQWCGRKRK
jgi:hypothetical protein